IEKASDALWQLLLGILDKGTLTLGDNRRVDFSQTMIFLTSNLGSHEVMNLMNGGMGFAAKRSDEDEELDQKIYRAATEAARRKFSPEFMNRIDKVIVFRALTRENLEKILDIELDHVQQRIINATDGRQFVFHCTTEARDFLLREGTDIKFGARHLKRSIERHLVFPISNLLATEQIQLGDLITVDFDALRGKLNFVKEDQGALVNSEEETAEETALVSVSVRTAGASRALAKRASREALG
ncbi:MAG TPA: AAA family ATPase, partial [Terriglobia bacterium]|nr:AAA family ATPase [Terriglobia bacterium]